MSNLFIHLGSRSLRRLLTHERSGYFGGSLVSKLHLYEAKMGVLYMCLYILDIYADFFTHDPYSFMNLSPPALCNLAIFHHVCGNISGWALCECYPSHRFCAGSWIRTDEASPPCCPCANDCIMLYQPRFR